LLNADGKIEHRMFCHITQNWRARPLVSREVIIQLMANTTTTAGLKIRAELDLQRYPTGTRVKRRGTGFAESEAIRLSR
jgi:hypothetical protein